MKQRPIVLFMVVLAISSMATLVRADAPASAPTTQTASYTRHPDVIYGRSYGTSLTMDVFTPTTKHNGAAILVMVSGGWLSSPEALGSPFMSVFFKPFTDRGYTIFAVVHGSQPKFTIPEIRENINRAVRFVRYHAKDWDIDPDRFGITGGSAGGHLSLLQGCGPLPANEKSPDPVERVSSEIQCVACLFPPTDFLDWGETNQNVLDVPNMKPFVAAFDFHELDPKTHLFMRIIDRPRIAEIEKEISPITHVSAKSPPTLIIHGDADNLVPIQQSQMMVEKLNAAKVPAELVVKKGAGHGWGDTRGDLEHMADWFDKYLGKDQKNN